MKTPIFTGAGLAMITPMNPDGSVNYKEIDRIIEDQITQHTDAIISCGTTGEASTLEDDEHLDVIKHVIKRVAGRIPVIAGTGSNNTAHAVMMSKEAADSGADGLLIVTPYYNKTSQSGLVASYTAVADATDLPVIMYNVPLAPVSTLLQKPQRSFLLTPKSTPSRKPAAISARWQKLLLCAEMT